MSKLEKEPGGAIQEKQVRRGEKDENETWSLNLASFSGSKKIRKRHFWTKSKTMRKKINCCFLDCMSLKLYKSESGSENKMDINWLEKKNPPQLPAVPYES